MFSSKIRCFCQRKEIKCVFYNAGFIVKECHLRISRYSIPLPQIITILETDSFSREPTPVYKFGFVFEKYYYFIDGDQDDEAHEWLCNTRQKQVFNDCKIQVTGLFFF
jgi:hypothetical protein